MRQGKATQVLAPGARVEIRNEEWIVRRLDRVGEGKALHVTGVSELVRGKEAIFLEQLEKKIQVLAPEDTILASDTSPRYRQSKLYIESLLQRYIPPMQRQPELYIGHRAAMNIVPFQLEPALQALEQPRQRILIADAVGLGKTLECGILLSELMRRGRGQRILVLAMKSILTQFQKEMWSRFSIPLTRLDSVGVRKIRQEIPSNHNPFDYHDKVIISIDTLKRDSEYRRYLEQAHWDIIVIDEAHNVADRSGAKDFWGQSRSQALRTKLARLLATRSDTLIMLSATPHDGKASSFASLMNMLNPTAIANPHQYITKDLNSVRNLYIRRFKKDILEQLGEDFQERRIERVYAQATPEEEAAYEALVRLKFQKIDQRSTGKMLFATTLEKSLFSSPAACLETIHKRIKELEKKKDADYTTDIDALIDLKTHLEAVHPETFSRYQALLKLVKHQLKWKKTQVDDRLVIFTERIATLKFLHTYLPQALKLKDNEVEILYGSMSDIEQQRVVESFGKENAKVRLLIASDVASEGINLHYLSHRMIHFDIPWSLMTFQQRNGRIDRYGQTYQPEIYYLMTESQVEKIKGDQRILDLLIEKDQQAIENIGDPSALSGKYNEEEEVALTAEAIEQSLTPEDFENAFLQGADLEGGLEALLAIGQNDNDEEDDTAPLATERTRQLPSLFANTLAYVQAGFEQLQIADYELHDDRQGVTLNWTPSQMPQDLKVRFRALPKEVLRKDQGLKFSMHTERIQADIKRCRKEENAWPEWHYLWEQHPFIEWLNDRVTTSFGRHQAPVIHLPSLPVGSTLFWFSGLYPSQNGHPIIWEWPGVLFSDAANPIILPLDEVLKTTGFGITEYPNPGKDFDETTLRAQLKKAVVRAQHWMEIQKEEFEGDFSERIQTELDDLARLKKEQVVQLALDFEQATGNKARQKAERERRIDRVFDDYQNWVKNSMSVASAPYLQLVAVFMGIE